MSSTISQNIPIQDIDFDKSIKETTLPSSSNAPISEVVSQPIISKESTKSATPVDVDNEPDELEAANLKLLTDIITEEEELEKDKEKSVVIS